MFALINRTAIAAGWFWLFYKILTSLGRWQERRDQKHARQS